MFWRSNKLLLYFFSINIIFLSLILYIYNKLFYSKLLLGIIFVIFCFLILVFLWLKYPDEFFDVKYRVKDNIDINKFDNSLFVFNHEKYEEHEPFKDPMIMTKEIWKTDKDFNVVTSFTPFKYLPIYKGYKCIFKGDNAVKKIINSIKKGENGLIFLLKDHEAKGIYYILKETKKPLVLVKKNKIDDIIEIEYIKYDYNLNLTPELFMEDIKKVLYD